MPLDAASVDDWVTAPAAGAAAAAPAPAPAAAAPAPAAAAGKDDWVTQAPLKDLPGGSASPATESYGFDVPSAAAQPQINTAVAPTPPAALEAAKQNVTSIKDIPARVGAAMIAAWRNTPDILTPQAQDWLANAEKNSPRPNLQDVLTVGHAALAAGSAVFQGGLAGVAALGDVVGQPELGRDVAGYYEAQGMADAPHFPGVMRTTLPETRAILTEQSIGARQALASPGPDLGAMAIKVMNAPDVNAAIAAATEATRDPASMYRPAPAAIPPNAAAPVLPRILDLINQDDTVAANRPAEIPPNAAQPKLTPGWGEMPAARTPNPALTEDIMNPPGSRPADQGTDLTTQPTEATPPAIPPADAASNLVTAMQGNDFDGASKASKQVASNLYQKADDVGGVLTPDFANQMIDEAEKMMPSKEEQIVTGDSSVANMIERMQQLRDQPLTLQGVQGIDEGLSNLISKEFGPVGLSKEGTKILNFQTTLRDMVNGAGPEDIQGGTEGFDALAQARAAWSQAMKVGDLARIKERADLTDNPATGIKSGIRVLLSNPSRARGYTDIEKDALRQAADRGALGGALHVFGNRLIPWAAGLAGEAAGGPVGMVAAAGAAHVATAGMRRAGTAIQTRRLGNALSVLGQPLVGQPLAAP